MFLRWGKYEQTLISCKNQYREGKKEGFKEGNGCYKDPEEKGHQEIRWKDLPRKNIFPLMPVRRKDHIRANADL